MVTFVSADWVTDHIGRPGYLIIDPRSAMRYLMGHLRGAVNVPFKKLQGPDGRLGPPEQLAAAFGDAGLGDGVTPVLYDHFDGRNAAMAAWVLEYLGCTDVHVMDLLFDAWKEQGREVLYRPVPTEPSALSAAPQPVGADDAERRRRPRRDGTPGYALPGGVSRRDGHGPLVPGTFPAPSTFPTRKWPAPMGKLLIEPELLRRAAGCRRHYPSRFGGGLLPQRRACLAGVPVDAAGRLHRAPLRRLLRGVDGQRAARGDLTFPF